MYFKRILSALFCAGLFTPAVFANPGDMARVVTQADSPVDCVSRVAVRKIDGREKFVSPRGFDLSPGTHTLSGTVAIDARNCDVELATGDWIAAPLEAEFEAGKTYYIGFDHSSGNRSEWQYVIWKVE